MSISLLSVGCESMERAALPLMPHSSSGRSRESSGKSKSTRTNTFRFQTFVPFSPTFLAAESTFRARANLLR